MNLLPTIDEVEEKQDLTKEPEVVVIDEDLSKVVDYDAPLDRIFVEKPTNGKKISISSNKKRVVIDPPPVITGGLPPGFAGHEPEVEKPVKKKRVQSEKQKAHLERIRILAYEKRMENKKKKEKIEIQSEEEKKEPEPVAEVKPDKKTIQEQKYLDRMEKRRLKVEQRIIEEEKEEELKLLELDRQKQENEYFEKFVKNMDKYNYLKQKNEPKQESKPVPKILNTQNNNPYKNIFDW